ncbi:MAG: acetyl-CoA carboxylase carboxyl transferase subunit alpha, partial [Synechococcaceae bacterium WB6_3A_227]|nr:acetyl-CoA carboxylase carboxyl transferase subunit alpha [Synechococcaceae bacterium WB6_3A_227]
GIVDRILPEPSGGNHWAPLQAAETLRLALLEELEALYSLEPELLLEQRYAKYRAIGKVLEDSAEHAFNAIKA